MSESRLNWFIRFASSTLTFITPADDEKKITITGIPQNTLCSPRLTLHDLLNPIDCSDTSSSESNYGLSDGGAVENKSTNGKGRMTEEKRLRSPLDIGYNSDSILNTEETASISLESMHAPSQSDASSCAKIGIDEKWPPADSRKAKRPRDWSAYSDDESDSDVSHKPSHKFVKPGDGKSKSAVAE